MKRNVGIGLIMVMAAILFSCNSGNKSNHDDGFVSLFNGENFDGWYLKIRNGDSALAQKVFTAGNGEIHVFKHLKDSFELNTGKNYTHGLFYTNKTYSRFIFRFEYKWGEKKMNNFDMFQYDAGMYYHVYNDKIWPKGIEYQVRYNHITDQNHTGDFWAAGTTFQWYMGEDKRFLLPSEGGVKQPIRKGEHLANSNVPHHALDGEWNKCEVIVMGDKYAIHKLNGVIVNMATELSHSEGKIGLQSETAEVFYRNISIKEFDKDIPIEEFLK
ncbi:MAG: DUF1080 domain-containing protein [Bacteroidales bacterium]|nr:DUF1080 domain-containing protein [Bacteroidales bacterium]